MSNRFTTKTATGIMFYCEECEKFIPAEEKIYGHDCEK